MKKILILALLVLAFVSCDKDSSDENPNCTKPGVISLDEINSSSVLFSWEANDETAWEIEYGLSGFDLGNGTVRQTSQTDFFIDGLTPDTGYRIYLRANCGSQGFSTYRMVDFNTEISNTSCSAPTDLFVADVGSDFVGIGWQENGETAWEVEYGAVGFPLGSGTVVGTSQSNVVLQGLMASTTYEIYVRANCGSQGFSDNTGPIVVTTDP